MKKDAVVFCHDNNIYVIGSSKTESGYYTTSSPYLKISLDSPDDEIGRIVLKVLTESPEKVLDPERIEASQDPILKFLGFKSHRAQGKASLSMDIRLQEGVVTIIPNERDGKGGYTSEWDQEKRYYPKAKTCPAITEEVGKLVLEQLKECKSLFPSEFSSVPIWILINLLQSYKFPLSVQI